jgi:arylsulfatase A-like enzyme/Flp pilus assembly protein TadD
MVIDPGRATLVCALSATLLATGCTDTPPRDAAPRDVLLVTLDTARADRFSYAGASPVSTPHTDALAREGSAFLQAVAPSPITLVSHASLMTGNDPPRHGVRNNGTFRLADEALTLAEALEAEGFLTAAFIGSAVLDARYGLDQGFETYDDAIPRTSVFDFGYARRRGGDVADAVLEWLEPQGGPTFVWVHLFDPHAPYDPPEPERSSGLHPYDATIAYTDRVLGSLLDGYRRLGRYERALVVVTADHGESLGEHDEDTHGVFIYDATIRIPLIIRAPGRPGGQRIERQARLTDVFPTVLSLVGADPPPEIDGVSLVPLLDGQEAREQPREAYLESYFPYHTRGWAPLRAVRTDGLKLIVGAGTELYDLRSDPDERSNLAESSAADVAVLRSRLDSLDPDAAAIGSGTLELDERTMEQLAALGYVWNRPAGEPADGELPDPRRQIVLERRRADAVRLFRSGDQQRALGLLREIQEEDPENELALLRLGMLERQAGDLEAATLTFGRMAALRPESAVYQERWGVILEQAGREAEALAAYRRALAIEPRRPASRSHAWRLMERLGRENELEAELKALLEADPADGQALARRIALRHRGAPEDRIAALESALAAQPGLTEVRAGLALALHHAGRTERAEALFREVLDADPYHHNASVVVATADLREGRAEAAIAVLETAAEVHREHLPILRLLAEAWLHRGDRETAAQVLEDCLRLAPRDAGLWLQSGLLSLDRGEWADAERRLLRATRLGSEDPRLPEALSRARSHRRGNGTSGAALEGRTGT